MARYLLAVDFQPGAVDTPMSEWKPEEITAHLDYYGRCNEELVASGELVDSTVLTGPDLAKIVTSDGRDRAGGHRRPVPGVQGVGRRLPDRRRGVRGARDRDRRAGVGGARARAASRCSSRSRCAG